MPTEATSPLDVITIAVGKFPCINLCVTIPLLIIIFLVQVFIPSYTNNSLPLLPSPKILASTVMHLALCNLAPDDINKKVFLTVYFSWTSVFFFITLESSFIKIADSSWIDAVCFDTALNFVPVMHHHSGICGTAAIFLLIIRSSKCNLHRAATLERYSI